MLLYFLERHPLFFLIRRIAITMVVLQRHRISVTSFQVTNLIVRSTDPPPSCWLLPVGSMSFLFFSQMDGAGYPGRIPGGGHVFPDVGLPPEQRAPPEARERFSRKRKHWRHALAVDRQGVPAPVPSADADLGVRGAHVLEDPAPAWRRPGMVAGRFGDGGVLQQVSVTSSNAIWCSMLWCDTIRFVYSIRVFLAVVTTI